MAAQSLFHLSHIKAWGLVRLSDRKYAQFLGIIVKETRTLQEHPRLPAVLL